MVWLSFEDFGLSFAEMLDCLKRCFEAEYFELLGIVVSQQPVPNMAVQISDGGMMEGADGGFLDRPYHPLGLSIAEMVGRSLAMFDAICRADRTKDITDTTIFSSFVVLDELNTVIREYGMDFVRDCFDEGFERACGDEFCRFVINSGKSNLRSSINRDIEKSFATFVSQFGNVDVKITDLVCFEPLRLLPIAVLGRREMPCRCKQRCRLERDRYEITFFKAM